MFLYYCILIISLGAAAYIILNFMFLSWITYKTILHSYIFFLEAYVKMFTNNQIIFLAEILFYIYRFSVRQRFRKAARFSVRQRFRKAARFSVRQRFRKAAQFVNLIKETSLEPCAILFSIQIFFIPYLFILCGISP